MNLRWMSALRVARILSLVLTAGMALIAIPASAFNQPSYNANAVQKIAVSALPQEAKATLRLIKQGGPFPHHRDGVVFGNYEKRLPIKQRGYYHEYTVKTPGVRNRGARRIVCGVSSVCYYSDDHYVTFKLILE